MAAAPAEPVDGSPTLEDVAAVLSAWSASGGDAPCTVTVIGDVGATNTRLRIRRDASPGDVAKLNFLVSSSRTLLATLVAVGDVIAKAGCTVSAGGLAITGPVVDGVVNGIANYAGPDPSHTFLALRELPPAVFPAPCRCLINDLAATCYGILALNEGGVLGDYFGRLWAPVTLGDPAPEKIAALPPAEPTPKDALSALSLDPTRNHIVVNVGTGLGNAALLSTVALSPPVLGGADGGAAAGVGSGAGAGSGAEVGRGGAAAPTPELRVAPVEFGHANVTVMADDAEFLDAYAKDMGRAVEWDDLCSGRGLQRCYGHCTRNRADADAHAKFGPANVARAACATDAAAAAAAVEDDEAVDKDAADAAAYMWLKHLVRFAQGLVCAFQPATLLLGGDNQVHNDAFVARVATALRNEFVSHSMERLGWMSGCTVYRQVKPYNLNQAGVVRCLGQSV